MARVPQAIHPNDEPVLREMLGIPRPHLLPPSTLAVYQRVARYHSAVTTASLSNIPSALASVAWHTEEAEARRMKVPPEQVAEAYVAECEADAKPKQKVLAGTSK